MTQTHLTHAQIQQSLDEYPVAPLVDYSLASGGIENSNYLITCKDNGRFVLTVLEQPSYCQHDHYVALLDACRANGLPVPGVLRTKQQTTAIEVAGKPALLGKFLSGSHISAPTFAHLRQVGRFVARLHGATQPLAGTIAAYPRDVPWMQRSLSELQPKIGYQDHALLEQAVTTTQALFERNDLASLSRGVIHGDLFRDNLLFNRQGLTGALDFHHASCGYHLFDLAVVANDWCIGEPTGDHTLLDKRRLMALLQSYHSVKPINQESLWWFASFCLYAAAVFTLSRLTTVHFSPEARSKAPEHFLRIVQGHLRHPPTLDGRLFA